MLAEVRTTKKQSCLHQSSLFSYCLQRTHARTHVHYIQTVYVRLRGNVACMYASVHLTSSLTSLILDRFSEYLFDVLVHQEEVRKTIRQKSEIFTPLSLTPSWMSCLLICVMWSSLHRIKALLLGFSSHPATWLCPSQGGLSGLLSSLLWMDP